MEACQTFWEIVAASDRESWNWQRTWVRLFELDSINSMVASDGVKSFLGKFFVFLDWIYSVIQIMESTVGLLNKKAKWHICDVFLEH